MNPEQLVLTPHMQERSMEDRGMLNEQLFGVSTFELRSRVAFCLDSLGEQKETLGKNCHSLFEIAID
jgi:hypothetical protein